MANWTNVQNWTGVLQVANSNSDGSFWLFILFGVWLVVLMLSTLLGFEVALLVSGFIGFIFGLFLVYADLLAWPWVLIFVGEILFTILYIAWTKK